MAQRLPQKTITPTTRHNKAGLRRWRKELGIKPAAIPIVRMAKAWLI
jgi:hypothetical protein